MSTLRRFKAGRCIIPEYQASFHPHSHKVIPSQSKPNCCPQKETTSNPFTFRSVYMSEQWTERAPKTQRLPEDTYTSVYKNDFQAWETKRPLVRKSIAHKAAESSSVNWSQEREPFEGVTCYSSDYVAHPVQPRQRRTLNPNLSSNVLPTQTYKSAPNSKDLHGSDEFFHKFEVLTLESKFYGDGKDSKPPAEHRFCTHEGCTEPESQGSKSIVFSVQANDKRMVTRTEFYRAWDGPQHFDSVQPHLNKAKKTRFPQQKPKTGGTKKNSAP